MAKAAVSPKRIAVVLHQKSDPACDAKRHGHVLDLIRGSIPPDFSASYQQLS